MNDKIENNGNYYAILPANVRYDKNLSANEKLLFAEITSLTNKTGICWASNSYFAEIYNCTPQAISKWIKKLERLGYLDIEYIYRNGSKEIEMRHIRCINNDKKGINNGKKGSNDYLGGYKHTIKENTINSNIIKDNNIENNISEILHISDDGKNFASYFRSLLPNTQKVTSSDMKKWAKIYDSLINLDKRTKDEIYKVTKWARSDNFWSSNFLSATKLRNRNKEGVYFYDVFLEKIKQEYYKPVKADFYGKYGKQNG